MNLSAFYDECLSIPGVDKEWVDSFYRAVIDVFGETNQDFTDIRKVHNLFYGNHSSLGKTQYYQRRRLIVRLYDWLAEQGEVDDNLVKAVYSLKLQDVIADGELYRYYFKNLDAALDFVCYVGRAEDFSDYDDLLNIKAIVILSWYLVAPFELQNLHKSDLQSETHTVQVNARKIQLEVRHFDILKRYAELDCHKGFPSRKEQNYRPSPFLFRSAYRTNLSLSNIRNMIFRFNEVAANYGKEISTLKLRRNGIFSQVYASGDDKTVNTLIRDLIGCDTAFAFGYKEHYERWKHLIMGDNTK